MKYMSIITNVCGFDFRPSARYTPYNTGIDSDGVHYTCTISCKTTSRVL